MIFEKKLNDFLNNENTKQKIIVVYGPTASGKTGLSLEIAKLLNTEIISTDSRQIFRELNIGTGKITIEEMQGIKHHMIDFVNPDDEYSVGEFKSEAEKCIEDIISKQKIPVLCGGTGLYIDSLIYDFDIPNVPADEDLRNKLELERLEFGNQYIWDKLNGIDSNYAKELHPNNYRYVIRALEVKMLTGKSKTEFRTEKSLKYDVLFLTPYSGNREELYNKINKRIQMMFDDGLVLEVQNLLKKYSKNDFGMKTIGYKEVIDYLEGNITLQECVDLVQKNNRNYAKRQLTWFRKYEEDLEI
ncbi:MAG: tRNA (adenosine(37)-N6)-dimethylallyltransferase MiaA [Candidatus Gracilibacteria bacterium]|nr:tRNA (adenosine(37)-N6)-dimethylallyltransferase MiaA [Candidatus Gracilibacteria bacterium]